MGNFLDQLQRCSDDYIATARKKLASEVSYRWEKIVSQTDSPIEAMLAAAYLIQIRKEHLDEWFEKSAFIFEDRGEVRHLESSSPVLDQGFERFDVIVPQVTIGQYRADFVMTRYKLFSKNEPPWALTKLIVECDGHQFHDASKESAARDKSRDRALQTSGFHVLRFTGSEIWNKPEVCAQEISTYFDKEYDRRFQELVDRDIAEREKSG